MSGIKAVLVFSRWRGISESRKTRKSSVVESRELG